jgi:DNA-binding HxlR family transcriptional regulator
MFPAVATEEGVQVDAAASPRGADSIFRTADVVGDAWAWLIMRDAVLHDVRRFSDFQERLGVPRSTLSARLSQLEAGGLLTRAARGSEYRVADAGNGFFDCLMVAMRWGDRWYFTPDTRPQPIEHLACGQALDAVLSCAACREVLVPARVSAARGATPDPSRGTDARRRRNASRELLERRQVCSIARTLTVIGDWWSGLIIRECFFGTRRFDDFERRLGIAPNILSGRLRQLVDVGILARIEYQSWPLRQEYRLTDKGLDLYHVPLAMLTWGQNWLARSDGEPHLTHQPCETALHAVLACNTCGDPVARTGITLQ